MRKQKNFQIAVKTIENAIDNQSRILELNSLKLKDRDLITLINRYKVFFETLEELYLKNNQLKNVDYLLDIACNLHTLSLDYNYIKDIHIIAHNKLQVLNLSNNKLKDISFINYLHSLSFFLFNNNVNLKGFSYPYLTMGRNDLQTMVRSHELLFTGKAPFDRRLKFVGEAIFKITIFTLVLPFILYFFFIH